MLLNGEERGVRFEVSGRAPVFIGRHALGLDKPDSRMSRQHAEVWLENGTWLLRDLNSTNGTFINTKRVHDLCQLEVGDHIRCGRTEFVVADIRGDVRPATPHDTTGDLEGTAVLPHEPSVALVEDEPAPQDAFDDSAVMDESAVIDEPLGIDEADELDLEPVVDDAAHESVEPEAPEADVLVEDVPETTEAWDVAAAEEAHDDALALDVEPESDPDADLVSLTEDEPDTGGSSEVINIIDRATDDQDHGRDHEQDGGDLSEAVPEAEAMVESGSDELHEPGEPATPTEPGTEDDDIYAAEPAVVGLSLGHTPPPDTEPAEADGPAEDADERVSEAAPEPAAEDREADSEPVETPTLAATEPEPLDTDDTDALSEDEIEAIVDLVEPEDDEADLALTDEVLDEAVEEASAPAEDASDEAFSAADAGSPDNPWESASAADADDAEPADDDDDVLKLGFQGAEPPHHADVDEPALRGHTPAAPGRFVVTETDDDFDADFDHPDATAERAALLGPGGLDADPEAAERWREPSRSRGPLGKGRQRLPLALVTVLAVVAASGALIYTGMQLGWIGGSTTVAGRDPGVDTSPTPDIATDTGTLASATTPNRMDRAPGTTDARSVFIDPRAMRRPAQPTNPQPDTRTNTDNSAAAGAGARADSGAMSDSGSGSDMTPPTPSAVAPGPAMPAPSAVTGTTPASTERVRNAEQLKALIDNATPDRGLDPAGRLQDNTTNNDTDADNRSDSTAVADATPTTEPAEERGTLTGTPPTPAEETQDEPQLAAAVDPSNDFARAGLTIGDPDSVFTRPRTNTEPEDAQAPEIADAVADDPTPPAPRTLLNPRSGTGVIRTARPDTTRPGAIAVPAGPRRVAFLVDVSGTMVDSMPQLRTHLSQAIEQLSPEQSFTVLMFRQGEAIELPPTGLRPANNAAKSAALDWLDADAQNVQLGGRSDPTPALRVALNHGVNELVVLSDNSLGRRAMPGGKDLSLSDLAGTLARYDGLKVNTIQFNYQDSRELLKNLAEQFDGDFLFVEEIRDANPDAPDIFGQAARRN